MARGWFYIIFLLFGGPLIAMPASQEAADLEMFYLKEFVNKTGLDDTFDIKANFADFCARINKPFRVLCIQWHPDKHSGDTKEMASKRFKALRNAREFFIAVAHDRNASGNLSFDKETKFQKLLTSKTSFTLKELRDIVNTSQTTSLTAVEDKIKCSSGGFQSSSHNNREQWDTHDFWQQWWQKFRSEQQRPEPNFTPPPRPPSSQKMAIKNLEIVKKTLKSLYALFQDGKKVYKNISDSGYVEPNVHFDDWHRVRFQECDPKDEYQNLVIKVLYYAARAGKWVVRSGDDFVVILKKALDANGWSNDLGNNYASRLFGKCLVDQTKEAEFIDKVKVVFGQTYHGEGNLNHLVQTMQEAVKQTYKKHVLPKITDVIQHNYQKVREAYEQQKSLEVKTSQEWACLQQYFLDWHSSVEMPYNREQFLKLWQEQLLNLIFYQAHKKDIYYWISSELHDLLGLGQDDVAAFVRQFCLTPQARQQFFDKLEVKLSQPLRNLVIGADSRDVCQRKVREFIRSTHKQVAQKIWNNLQDLSSIVDDCDKVYKAYNKDIFQDNYLYSRNSWDGQPLADPWGEYQELIKHFVYHALEDMAVSKRDCFATRSFTDFGDWLSKLGNAVDVHASYAARQITQKLFDHSLNNSEVCSNFYQKITSSCQADEIRSSLRLSVENSFNNQQFAKWQTRSNFGYMAAASVGLLGLFLGFSEANFAGHADLKKCIELVWLLYSRGRGWTSMSEVERDEVKDAIFAAFQGSSKKDLANYIAGWISLSHCEDVGVGFERVLQGQEFKINFFKMVPQEVKDQALALLEKLWLERQASRKKKRRVYCAAGMAGAAAIAVGSLIYKHLTRPSLISLKENF